MDKDWDDRGDERLLMQTSDRELVERPATSAAGAMFQPEADGSEDDDRGINLLEIWRMLLKRKWTIITFFLIVVTAAVMATFLQTPIYQAKLVLQIEREAQKILDFQSAGDGTGAGAWDFYQTQYELLKSRSLAEKVVERLNLVVNSRPEEARKASLMERLSSWFGSADNAADPDVRAAPVPMSPGMLLGSLTVEPVRDSRLVRLYYKSPDPALAAKIVNAWAETYITMNLERRFDASTYAREFLEDQLQQIKVRLEDSERELVDFARREEIINFDDRQTVINEYLQEVHGAVTAAEQERIKAEVLYQQMRKTDGAGLTRILENELIGQFKQTKAELEAQYQDSLKTFKPAYPKMQRLATRISDIEASIDAEVDNIRAAITADYKAAKQREEMLKGKLEATKSAVMALQDRSIQYNILKREVDTNRQLHEGLLQEYKEVGVAAGVGTNNVSIVDKAEIPAGPFKPDLRKNVLLAVFLGLFGGIGLAFLFEHLDDTVKLPEDLERNLGISILGVIPKERGEMGTARPDLAPLALRSQQDPRSVFAEAYRSVRTSLQFSTSEGTPRVLSVTSAIPSEGKTTTALSLAIQFAQSGKKVLLIDSDLRKPSLHRSLNMENVLGLTAYLAGDATPSEISKPTVIPNLFVIPAGHLPPNPAELIASAKMVSLLSLAAEKFDQVILDCPPVLGLSDALILGNIAAGTLLVVESGGTRRGNAQGALKRLKTARTKVLGGVLTKLDARSHAYGSYYQSYYYYCSEGADAAQRKRLAA